VVYFLIPTVVYFFVAIHTHAADSSSRNGPLASIGRWKDLEKRATKIVSNAVASAGSGRLSPILGGGTRLMFKLIHRISRASICLYAIGNELDHFSKIER